MANVNLTISPASNAKKATYISDANILKLSNIRQKYFLYKNDRKKVRIFSFLFSYAKNTTHIEENQSEVSQLSIQDSSNGKVVESWPDLEMNSAQVAFLDFERPCCWILAWSWNELSSGSLFRPWTATLLNPGLILKWTHVAHVWPRFWTLVWSWNELVLLTYGHVVESWPDLEMNSRCSRTATLLNPGLILKWTRVAHVRPRCWILAWSWNELTLLTYGHVVEPWSDLEMNLRCSRTATLLNPGLILKWTQLR